jgi:hypothetical protein
MHAGTRQNYKRARHLEMESKLVDSKSLARPAAVKRFFRPRNQEHPTLWLESCRCTHAHTHCKSALPVRVECESLDSQLFTRPAADSGRRFRPREERIIRLSGWNPADAHTRAHPKITSVLDTSGWNAICRFTIVGSADGRFWTLLSTQEPRAPDSWLESCRCTHAHAQLKVYFTYPS